MKTCKDCQNLKPLQEFSQYNPRTLKDGTVKYYYRPYCKSCMSKRGEIFKRRRRELDPEYRAEKNLKSAIRRSGQRQSEEYRAYYLLADCKQSDKRKGLVCDLTRETITKIISPGDCSYCGETDLRLSLDRRDNSVGHTQNNVIRCCIRCNMIRGAMPFEAWMTLVPAIRSARELGQFGDWTAEIHKRK